MLMNTRLCLWTLVAALVFASPLPAEENEPAQAAKSDAAKAETSADKPDADKTGDAAARLEAIKRRLAGQEYSLQYKFAAGEEVRYRVVHLVTVATTIKGNRQTAQTRSISTKLWKVSKAVDGKFTFEHVVEDVDMWNKISLIQEVKYNSRTDKQAPPGYEDVARSVGVTLSTVTVDQTGEVLERSDTRQQAGLGGQLLIPMPAEPVKLGAKWFHATDVMTKLKDGGVKRIKTRQQYTLDSVTDGIAKILVTTQILQPVNDAEIKVQLVQRLTHGELSFDLERGRVIDQKLSLDETVIGFNGADSLMQYVGKFTETIIDPKPSTEPPTEPRTASKPDRPSDSPAPAKEPAPASEPTTEPAAPADDNQPAEDKQPAQREPTTTTTAEQGGLKLRR